jgi:hypothetical protein
MLDHTQELSEQPQAAGADPIEPVRLTQFTLKEQARLLLLRGRVQDAKMGSGPFREDLQAV